MEALRHPWSALRHAPILQPEPHPDALNLLIMAVTLQLIVNSSNKVSLSSFVKIVDKIRSNGKISKISVVGERGLYPTTMANDARNTVARRKLVGDGDEMTLKLIRAN